MLVTPDASRIAVFSKGTCIGLNGFHDFAKKAISRCQNPKKSSREATYHLIVDFTCQKSLFQDAKL